MTHYSPTVKDPILNIISIYQNLTSMKSICKTKTNCKNQFFLKTSTLDAAENELKRLNLRKAFQVSNILTKICKLKMFKMYIYILLSI